MKRSEEESRVWSNLSVTGSIGILLKAKSIGYALSIPEAINRMRDRGIWLSQDVIRFALERSTSSGKV